MNRIDLQSNYDLFDKHIMVYYMCKCSDSLAGNTWPTEVKLEKLTFACRLNKAVVWLGKYTVNELKQ